MIGRGLAAGAVLAFGLLWTAAAAPVSAAPAVASAQVGEHISAFTVDAVIRGDGAVDVTETITYEFGIARRHGIEREIDIREAYDDKRDRLYVLSGVEVTSPTGAPADLQLIRNAASTIIRIGDPRVTITGQQVYRLHYTLSGLMNSFADYDELFWEATGTRWQVNLAGVAVTVSAPGGVNKITCYAGDAASTSSCAQQQLVDPAHATFGQPTLSPGQGLTVVVGLDKGVVTVSPPALTPTIRSPWATPPSSRSYVVAGAAVACTAVFGGLLWLRRGRDRTFVGLPLGLAPASGQVNPEALVPIGGGPEPAVAFTPPKGLRPALAGLLLAQRTSSVQVSATIVDLAVRGYLRIDQLARYEQTLLDELFHGQPAVRMSQLRTKFADSYRLVGSQLTDQGFRAGWFRQEPRVSSPRPQPRQLIGCLMFLVVVPVSFTGIGSLVARAGAGWSTLVVVFGLVLAGLIAFGIWRVMPARTALGRAVWAQTVGFRKYLATAEASQLRHEEATDVFSRYLPYAMIFGLTRRWAAVFAALAEEQGTAPEVYWYGGYNYGGPGSLGHSLDNFGRTGGAVLTSTPGSSSSGSSGFAHTGSVGGGGGGGGGSSW
jgi:Predicted membrane protein (DUF2207)